MPSRIFGCTGLKSKIAIKNIIHGEAKDYLNLWNKPPIKVKGSQRGWPFPDKYFYEKFTIEFSVENKSILKDILFPLLNFIEKYGYLGGKNNLGFGRAKFILENDNYGEIKDYETFNLSNYGDELKDKSILKAVEEYNNVEDMYFISKIGLYVKNERQYEINHYYKIINELIAEKAKLRSDFKKKFKDKV